MFPTQIAVVIQIPALDRLIDRWDRNDAAQKKIDALTQRLHEINAAETAALKGAE